MKELTPKVGDIYRWSWNEVEFEKRKDQNKSGTLYWCASRICIFKDDGKFWDTYWGGENHEHDRRFSIEDAAAKLSLKFVANFDDLVEADKSQRAYYKDADCVDISHPNKTRGGFYIRKGAERSFEKMRRVMTRTLREYERTAKSAAQSADRIRVEIERLRVESYVLTTNNISLSDESYEDQMP
jgi:hypothetical protein